MTDLKPCPFCGCKCISLFVNEKKNSRVPWDSWRAVCGDGGAYLHQTGCGTYVHVTSKEQAIIAWNTRPAEDKLTAEVERLRRGLGNIEVRTDVVGTEEEYDHEDMLHDIDRMVKELLAGAGK